MTRRKLNTVTLLGIDCVNIERLMLAADICQKDFDFADIKLLTSLPTLPNATDRRIVRISKIASVEEYSRFVIANLDDYIDTPHVLIIQYDGFILNPAAWTDEFLNFDYIGAPWLTSEWSIREFNFPRELLGKYVVGNGGFSLRSKKFISLCASFARENNFKKYHPEDVVLCVENRQLLENTGVKFAPASLAKQFSYEAGEHGNDKWDGQFGFHGLSWTDITKWLDAHPEYKGRIINDVTGSREYLKQQATKI